MNKYKDKIKSFFCILIITAVIVGTFMYVKSKGLLGFMESAESFKQYIESYGDSSRLVFFLIQFMSVIIAPIPSNISALAGGNVFGTWESFLISTLAISSASIVVFLLGRRFGRAFAERLVGSKLLKRYEHFFSSKKGELLLILALFLPFFPDDAICIIAGLSSISLIRYSAIIMLTRPWGIFAASALGASDIAIPVWGWGIITLFIVYVAANSDKIEKKLVSIFKLKIS